jgi:DNA-binding NarL/FixJ family response regulator
MPRVFVADDRKDVLQAVVQVLEGEFKVVGTAEDGMSTLALVPQIDPDILVLDISMPLLNGIEVAMQLKNAGSQAKIVFLTVHEDCDFVRAAMSAGALGYVLKPCLASDLVPAIRKALKDCTFVSPAVDLA